jgi:hypothetical protein
MQRIEYSILKKRMQQHALRMLAAAAYSSKQARGEKKHKLALKGMKKQWQPVQRRKD